MVDNTVLANSALTVSSSYKEARDRFLALANMRGAKLKSFQNQTGVGMEGESLYCDMASFGNPKANKYLVISSGTHGVEGFCGSAIQCGMMEHVPVALDREDLHVVLVHAINPHGFSYLRRVNEDNIDLNRNFANDAKHRARDDNYLAFRACVFPDDWRGSDLQSINQAVQAYIDKFGLDQFQTELTKGQYSHAHDPYYGGAADSWSRKIWNQICSHIASHAELVAHFDIHTGLGHSGDCELIYGGRPVAGNITIANKWYGEDNVKVPSAGESLSADVSGTITSHLDNLETVNIAIGMEFGTVPIDQMLFTLIADNWLGQNPNCDPAIAAMIHQRMRGTFVGDSAAWRDTVWNTAVLHLDQTVRGLMEGA